MSRRIELCAAILVVWAWPGQATRGADAGGDRHWAFEPLRPVAPRAVRHRELIETPVDAFIEAALEAQGLTLAAAADRTTWLRRVTFDLVGLPPTAEELAAFAGDTSLDAWEQATDRLLASPRYGERWGKYWLDVAGYADSNGYFNADSDRPLAYLYRDYVVRAFNGDKPFDQFIREQLAGDELGGYGTGGAVTDETRSLLAATHYLRNAPDGTNESDGNPDELTVDRATPLEGAVRIVVNSLLGLTIQCARCHDHKFEPIAQEEYYRLESVFYPAFPAFHPEKWIKPKDRVEHVASPAETAAWEAQSRRAGAEVASLRAELANWVKGARPRGTTLFEDDFDGANGKLAPRWTNTLAGEHAPAGNPPVNVDSAAAPGAIVQDGALRVIAGPAGGDRWLVTSQTFHWAPDQPGDWIQASFDLVADRLVPSDAAAARIAYLIALRAFARDGTVRSGNILLDGNPAGAAAIYLNYPSADAKPVGAIGVSGFQSGRNYGVRVTNLGDGKYQLQQLVDWLPEDKPLALSAADLPDGAFGFEYCCGRSFVVDNVAVEHGSAAEAGAGAADFAAQLKLRREKLDQALATLKGQPPEKPGKLAFITDIMSPAPDVFLLERGSYASPRQKVEPAGLAALCDGESLLAPLAPEGGRSTGRRLAFANWITRPDSRASALVARVIANRIWQHHFGRGLVATPDNFGRSGAKPSHPELLEYLASELVKSGWSIKSLHRLILVSAAYRQTSRPAAEGGALGERVDPDNRLSWHYPLRRLDAEAIRDAALAAAGELDTQMFGPYTATERQAEGAVVVKAGQPGERRRSIYLQQRRTQVATLLALFDAPSITSNCAERASSTVPLQSLALLNSEFLRREAAALAQRLAREAGESESARVRLASLLVAGREPDERQTASASEFLASQQALYAPAADSRDRAWTDLCQMLLASNAFLYVE